MNQFTEIKSFRTTKEQIHYLSVLKNTYKVKTDRFIREAITEKMKRDVPNIREKYREEKIRLPF